MTLGQRVAVLNEGRVQQVAAPHALYDAPANVFVAGFIGTPPMNLFPTRITPGDGGQVQLAIGDQAIRLAATRVGGMLPEASRHLTGGIRPEAFSIAADAAPGSIATRVEHVEYLGHETLVHVIAGNGAAAPVRLVARLEGMRELRPGEQISLRAEPERIHLFDEQGMAVRQ
jgi:ABC-type sugar transport system ATPase subunit